MFSWFTDVADYSLSEAATSVSLVTLVSAANFMLLGPLTEKLSQRGYTTLIVPLVGQVFAMRHLFSNPGSPGGEAIQTLARAFP